MDADIEYVTDGVFVPDGGVDFVLVRRSDGKKIAFQVKRRQNDAPERVQPVREFIGAIAGTPYREGYFVSTAERFTRTVVREIEAGAQYHKERGIEIQLVDGSRLRELLKLTTPEVETAVRLEEILGATTNWWKQSPPCSTFIRCPTKAASRCNRSSSDHAAKRIVTSRRPTLHSPTHIMSLSRWEYMVLDVGVSGF